MIPVLTSFLPPTHAHLYLPALFELWRAFNSHLIDDALLELCGELAEEHILGSVSGAGGSEWRDVGIWTDDQWHFLVTKALNSMSKYKLSRIFFRAMHD